MVIEDKWDDIFKNEKEIGYFIECDLEYPKELHDLHNDYPLAPEKLIVQDDWLSPFCKNLKENLNCQAIKQLFSIKKNMYYMLEILTFTKILVAN